MLEGTERTLNLRAVDIEHCNEETPLLAYVTG